MARRFGKNLENPERRLENEGEFNQTIIGSSMDNSYEDEFDKKLDAWEGRDTSSKRRKFLQEIKVEQPQIDTPLTLAYKELDRARQTGKRENIISAEDKILDLERQEEENGYKSRIAELKQMRDTARANGDEQALARFSQMRKSLATEMQYDELNYKIKKLQNSQKLEPSREKLQQIIELKKELETLELESFSK